MYVCMYVCMDVCMHVCICYFCINTNIAVFVMNIHDRHIHTFLIKGLSVDPDDRYSNQHFNLKDI